MKCPLSVTHRHVERMDHGDLGLLQSFPQRVFLVAVQQEAHRSSVHAVDGDAAGEVDMHGLEHQAITAERNNGVGLLGRDIAVALGKLMQRVFRLFSFAGDEGDIFEAYHDQISMRLVQCVLDGPGEEGTIMLWCPTHASLSKPR